MKLDKFFKSFLNLAMGSFIAQLIVVLLSPIVTRVYSVTDMGVYALVLTVISLFGSVINGKFDMALVTSKDDEDIPTLIILSFLFSLIFSTLISIFLYLYLLYSGKALGNNLVSVLLICFLLLLTGITNILISYNNRKKEYKMISMMFVIRTTFQNVFLVVFGFLNFGIIGMILSQILGISLGINTQYKSIKNDRLDYKCDLKKLKSIFLKYKEYPKYSLIANLTNNLSYSMVNIFISIFYGMEMLGYYSLTYRILVLPLSLISANVSKVYFREATEEYHEKGIFKETLFNTSKFLLIFSIPMFIVLVLFAPFLFKVVFGVDWLVSGYYAQILSAMFAIRLIVSSLTQSFYIVKKQKQELRYQFLFIIFSLLSFLLSYTMHWGMFNFLIIYSFLTIFGYVLMYYNIYKISGGLLND